VSGIKINEEWNAETEERHEKIKISGVQMKSWAEKALETVNCFTFFEV
jgi:hypothetical protein